MHHHTYLAKLHVVLFCYCTCHIVYFHCFSVLFLCINYVRELHNVSSTSDNHPRFLHRDFRSTLVRLNASIFWKTFYLNSLFFWQIKILLTKKKKTFYLPTYPLLKSRIGRGQTHIFLNVAYDVYSVWLRLREYRSQAGNVTLYTLSDSWITYNIYIKKASANVLSPGSCICLYSLYLFFLYPHS
jgi:hypothetical protein